MQFGKSLQRHDQEKVVVSKHAVGRALLLQRFHTAQHTGRIWAAIYQVTYKVNLIFRRIKAHQRKEFAELRCAALHVANDIRAHRGAAETKNAPSGAFLEASEWFTPRLF